MFSVLGLDSVKFFICCVLSDNNVVLVIVGQYGGGGYVGVVGCIMLMEEFLYFYQSNFIERFVILLIEVFYKLIILRMLIKWIF